MNFAGTAQVSGSSFGEAERADFTGFDEFGHGADGFLDGDVGIDAVLVVKINGFDAEALEAAFNSAADVGGRAVRAAARAVGIDAEAELGGDDDAVAGNFSEKLSDEFFIRPRAVDFGGIEEVTAEFQVTMKNADGFGFIGGAVGPGHAHAAEAERGNGGATLTKISGLAKISVLHLLLQAVDSLVRCAAWKVGYRVWPEFRRGGGSGIN